MRSGGRGKGPLALRVLDGGACGTTHTTRWRRTAGWRAVNAGHSTQNERWIPPPPWAEDSHLGFSCFFHGRRARGCVACSAVPLAGRMEGDV